MTTVQLVLVIPWPPSVNGYWRTFGGRQILSKRGRVFREAGALAIASQVSADRPPMTGRLAVEITLCPPTVRSFDIDNFAKAPLDLLTHVGIWADDSQVDSLTIRRDKKRKGGCAMVTIRRLV